MDQCLLTDTNGNMAWLQFETMGFPRVKPSCVVSYIDHNVYQTDSRNTDDHRYMQTASARYGAWFSKPGNGICHQVHFETFSVPGQFVLGTDSHTPLCGSTGMLAIGAGGLDVAVAMGGGAYYLAMPKVVRVWLTGQLKPWVHAKDVILELLRRYSVRGGQRQDLRVRGAGRRDALPAPARDDLQHGRRADADDERVSLRRGDAQLLRPPRARGRSGSRSRPTPTPSTTSRSSSTSRRSSRSSPCPPRPTRSCRCRKSRAPRSSRSWSAPAPTPRGRTCGPSARPSRASRVAPSVHLVVFPGSQPDPRDHVARGSPDRSARRRRHGLRAHVRLLRRHRPRAGGRRPEPARLQPQLRRAERRQGRPGLSLLAADRGGLGAHRRHHRPARRAAPRPSATTPLPLPPPTPGSCLRRRRARPRPSRWSEGPTSRKCRAGAPSRRRSARPCCIKLGDKVSTDDISPSGTAALVFRSNVPAIAEFTFKNMDAEFVARAKAAGTGVLVGGEIYGQGSSREAAVLAPLHLGVRAVLAKSFARIHRANLINWGLVPLEFDDPRRLRRHRARRHAPLRRPPRRAPGRAKGRRDQRADGQDPSRRAAS